MFKNLLKKISNNEIEISDKEKFDNAMQCAQELVVESPDDLHFLIKMFGRNIQYDYFSNFVMQSKNFSGDIENRLYSENLWIDWFREDGISESIKEWFSKETRERRVEVESEIIVDLSKDIVLPWPWKKQRFF